jgi:hypothetical protein
MHDACIDWENDTMHHFVTALGGNIEVKNKMGLLPIHFAVIHNHVVMIELLVGECQEWYDKSVHKMSQRNNLKVYRMSRFY